jgi:hypothetical protein
MKNTLIYSVPGSGTRFCLLYLSQVLGYRTSKLEDLVTFESGHLGQVHTDYNDINDIVCRAKGLRVVVPLRDPYHSFITRTYKPNWSPTRPAESVPLFELWWHRMIEVTKTMDVIYLPVDRPELDRYKLLQSIATHCEVAPDPDKVTKFADDWSKVGSMRVSPQKEEYLEQGTVDGKPMHFLDFAVEWQEGIVAELKTVQ